MSIVNDLLPFFFFLFMFVHTGGIINIEHKYKPKVRFSGEIEFSGIDDEILQQRGDCGDFLYRVFKEMYEVTHEKSTTFRDRESILNNCLSLLQSHKNVVLRANFENCETLQVVDMDVDDGDGRRVKRVKGRKGSMCDENCAAAVKFIMEKFPERDIELLHFYRPLNILVNNGFKATAIEFISGYERDQVRSLYVNLMKRRKGSKLKQLILQILAEIPTASHPDKSVNVRK